MFTVVDLLILGVGLGGIFTLAIAYLNRKTYTRKVEEFKVMQVVGYALVICSIGGMVLYKAMDKFIIFLEALL